MSAILMFAGELRDFLPGGNSRARAEPDHPMAIEYPITRRASVKDVIEALGAPHPEVGRLSLACDGAPELDFRHILADREKVLVEPVTPPFDPTVPSRLRPEPLEDIRFLVDVNVAKLAMLLRLVGLDAAHDPRLGDRELAHTARDQGRILLTKDRTLLKRSAVVFGRYVRSVAPSDQLLEILAFFGLKPQAPFSRCVRCNVELKPVAKEVVLDKLLPLTRRYYHTFTTCPSCGRVYWPGSHHERLRERLARLGLTAAPGPAEAGKDHVISKDTAKDSADARLDGCLPSGQS